MSVEPTQPGLTPRVTPTESIPEVVVQPKKVSWWKGRMASTIASAWEAAKHPIATTAAIAHAARHPVEAYHDWSEKKVVELKVPGSETPPKSIPEPDEPLREVSVGVPVGSVIPVAAKETAPPPPTGPSKVVKGARKLKGLAGRILHAAFKERWEVWGYDVNLAHQATALTGKVAQKVGEKLHVVDKAPQTPTDQEIREELGILRTAIDARIAEIPREIEGFTLVTPQQPLTPPVSSRSAIAEIIVREVKEREELIKNIVNFSAITFLDQTLFNNKRSSTLNFFAKLNGTPDPKQAYIQSLSKLRYVLAKILLPLISWFLKLVIQPPPEVSGGLDHMKEVAKTYFQDPENTRQEIEALFKNSSTYFYKLRKLHETFLDIKKNPQHVDFGLTIEQFLDKHLKDDVDENSLYKKFNSWLSELFHVKSGIPVVGGIIDKILNAILKRTVTYLDPIRTTLNSQLGPQGVNPTFTYNLTDLVISKIKELHTQLLQSQTLPQSPIAKGTRVSEPTAAAKLGEQERAIFKEFFDNFLAYLPLEDITENTLAEALKQQALQEGRGSYIHQYVAKQLRATLEEMFLELGGLVVQHTSNTETKLNLYVDILNVTNTLFAPTPSIVRTTDDCTAILQEAKDDLAKLLKTALEFKLQRLPSETAMRGVGEKTALILQNHHDNVEKFTMTVEKIRGRIARASSQKDLNEIEKMGHTLLFSVKNHLTECTFDLEDALNFKDLDQETKDNVKKTISHEIAHLHHILEEEAALQSTVAHLRSQGPILSHIETLFPDKDSENDLETVLPKRSAQSLLHDLEALPKEHLSELQLSSIQRANNHIDAIEKENDKLKNKGDIEHLLNQTLTHLNHAVMLNKCILSRPKEDQILYLQQELDGIDRLFNKLLRTKEPQTLLDDIDELSECIESFSAHLRPIIAGVNGEEREILEQSLSHIHLILSNVTEARDSVGSGAPREKVQASIKPVLQRIWRSLQNAQLRIHEEIAQAKVKDQRDQQELFDLLKVLRLDAASLRKYGILEQLLTPIAQIEQANASSKLSSRQKIQQELLLSLQLANAAAIHNIEEAEQSLHKKMKEQSELILNLSHLHADEGSTMDKDYEAIETRLTHLAQETEEIRKEDAGLKTRDVLFSSYIGSAKAAKYIGKPEILGILEEIIPKLIHLILNPRHREQLILRGPLSRI